jgi:hypothetical protein
MSTARQAGRGLLGLLQGLALVALLVTLAAGSLAPTARRRAVDLAARGLATRLRGLALAAVRDGRPRALAFPATGADEPLREVVDGDGDGIRRADVRRGVDPAGAAFTLAREHPGVRIGRPGWPSIAELPGRPGRILADEPAVRFGRARLAVLQPDGRATPGSVFVTDGREALCAVVVTGATARVRTFCYQRRSDAWSAR